MKNNEKLISEGKKRAQDYFKMGMNCSECVFQSVLDLEFVKFPPEVISLATGFGGGMGLAGNNCGALSGAILAVSSVHGRKNPLEKETVEERIAQLNGKEGVYRLFNQIPHSFQKQFGTTNCSELVKDYEWHSRERRRLCKEAIGQGAALAVYWILKGLEEGYSQPFGANVGDYQ